MWATDDHDGGDRLAALVHRLRRRLPGGEDLLVSVRGEGLRLSD